MDYYGHLPEGLTINGQLLNTNSEVSEMLGFVIYSEDDLNETGRIFFRDAETGEYREPDDPEPPS